MGTEALWVPAVMAAVGTGIQAKEADTTARRQDENAAQGIRTQSDRQRQADARVGQEVNKLQASSPEDAQKQATDAFMEQLNRTKSQAYGANSAGATSSAYNTDSANAATDVSQYGANRAGVLGRIDAPGLQRTAENNSRARAGTDLNLINRNAAGDQFLNQLRGQQIAPNPWAMAGGDVLKGAGYGMAKRGYGTGPTPVGVGTPQNGNLNGFADSGRLS